GGRRESGDKEPGAGVAEAGDGSPPVRLVSKRGTLLTSHRLTPFNEARARAALDDLFGELGQCAGLSRRGSYHVRIVRAGTVPSRGVGGLVGRRRRAGSCEAVKGTRCVFFSLLTKRPPRSPRR